MIWVTSIKWIQHKWELCLECYTKPIYLILVKSIHHSLSHVHHVRRCFEIKRYVSRWCCEGWWRSWQSQDVDTERHPSDDNKYRREHAGVTWHQAPLLHIEPVDHVLCTLHLLLSVTKSFWRLCILDNVRSEEMVLQINEAVKKNGIYIRLAATNDNLHIDLTIVQWGAKSCNIFKSRERAICKLYWEGCSSDVGKRRHVSGHCVRGQYDEVDWCVEKQYINHNWESKEKGVSFFIHN